MKIPQLIVNAIFGNTCPCCKELMTICDERYVCSNCDKLLRGFLKNQSVAIPSDYIIADKYLFEYSNQTVRKIVIEMKNRPLKKNCEYFADIAAECIKNDLDFPDFDIIAHCPRKPSKKRIIGYDHSQYFAKALAVHMNKPYIDLIGRYQSGKEQKTLKSIHQRSANVKNKFYAKSPDTVKRKRILIVDDIVTSGSTVNECAKILKKSGARKVLALFILN